MNHDKSGNAAIVQEWGNMLQSVRGINISSFEIPDGDHVLDLLNQMPVVLSQNGFPREGNAFKHVSDVCATAPNYGGLGLDRESPTATEALQEVNLLLSAWLESLNSEDRSRSTMPRVQPVAPKGRPPMNTTEKIFAIHSVNSNGYVQTGDTILVSIDWIMASEASWAGMERTYDQVGKPGIFRNDRFWLAGDHVVDPRVNHSPIIKKLITSSENARKVFKMTDYQGLNYTIMHTEFYRERAQPGMFIIGSDSHTCSSGANGCLAIGLGAADVTMGLITGEIWFKVPEVINIKFVGCPARGIGGKDIILYVLQKLKRNTVAADRIVEYTGPALDYLSPDARFAIANMTTEFGGITGIFAPDHITKSFVDGRRLARHRDASVYLRPDENAKYAETFEIDLSKVESFVAKYPNPDDVVPVSDMTGLKLDGCFIGACTTTEEDIVLGALVLEQGLKNGKVPLQDGKIRKIVPGSRPILAKLEESGLAGVYREAGFEVGIPGCSYCVGMSADAAKPGEIWLSSQNRNFENRMGKGSIGNLASAATVAASSFEMEITNPQYLIDQIPLSRWEALKGRGSIRSDTAHATAPPNYVHPAEPGQASEYDKGTQEKANGAGAETERTTSAKESQPLKKSENFIHGKIQKLGDFVDTDALAPAQFLVTARTNEALGSHCLEFTNPSFRQRVEDGFDIVVAGRAFGCGSSREQAVNALLGCGVKCVIAESFAFIYSRNQASLGLIGITMQDADFFSAAADGEAIHINLDRNVARIADRDFHFSLSEMEKSLVGLGGLTPAFMKYGKEIFSALCKNNTAASKSQVASFQDFADKALQW